MTTTHTGAQFEDGLLHRRQREHTEAAELADRAAEAADAPPDPKTPSILFNGDARWCDAHGYGGLSRKRGCQVKKTCPPSSSKGRKRLAAKPAAATAAASGRTDADSA